MGEFRGTDRFVLQRRLGAGGMGVVYQAADQVNGGLVALKTLNHLDARAIYRLKSEFRALADLAHPNLVRLGELFGEGDEWFFTMELVAGVDFLTWIRGRRSDGEALEDAHDTIQSGEDQTLQSGPPAEAATQLAIPLPEGPRADERRLRAALAQLAAGIAALHAAGKVHRDIKPSNVIVDADGRVVLLDFGLVSDAERRDRLESIQIVGTATYMAPEQAASLAVGPAADWYALGAMLYEALTGRAPFRGALLEVLLAKQSYEPTPPRTLVPDVPADLDALCASLLRREPRDRPPGAQILERLGAGEAPLALPMASLPSLSDASPFVGRHAELGLLHAAFAEAESGLPISTFVLGESGMGKSALVRRFLDEVERARPQTLVLTGRCYERESVPFKAFDAIVDALARHLAGLDQVDVALLLPRDVATLARVFPVLRRVPALARAPEARLLDPHELRTRAFAALRELLTRLAGRGPVIVYIDDFQWADADSLALFTAIMHGMEAPPLHVVATVRGEPADVAASRLPATLAEIERVPGDQRILPLAALSPDEANGLATLLLDASGAGRSDLGAISREAAGHPMFIHELVRHLATTSASGTEVHLDDALWARVGLLDASARRFLEVIAVAGEPLPQRVVMQVAGLEASDHARVTGALRVASLVRTSGTRGADTVECYHDRIREAVVSRLDAAVQRQHHERLANALEAAAGHDVQALVRHLEAAGLTERAAEQAAHAAGLAAHSLAFDQSAAMYATALRLGRHDASAARQLRMAMADALVNAGRGSDAADAYLVAAEGADDALRLECRRKASHHLLVAGAIERGLATLASVLAELGEKLPATPRAALLGFLWNRTKLRLRGLGFTPREESAISPRDLVMIDIYHSVGIGLGFVDTVRSAAFQSKGLLLALKSGEPMRIARAIALDAGILASGGPASNARAVMNMGRMREIIGDEPTPFLRAWYHGASGMVEYLGGRFAPSVGLLERAEQLMREETIGHIWELNTVRIFRLLALRQLGRWGEMSRGVAIGLQDASRRGDKYAETTLTRALNLYWLIQDDPTRARCEVEQKSWSPPEGGYHMQHWYELRARGDIALYAGDLEVAGQVLDVGFAALGKSFFLRIQNIRTESAWLRGRLALLRGDRVEAARAARQLAREGVAYARAWSALLEAGVAGKAQPAKVRERLGAAIEVARAEGMQMIVAAASWALGDGRGEELMEQEGAKAPAKILAWLIPGLA